MENLDITKYITKYLDIAVKRKWWIIIPTLISILGGLSYGLITPRIYQSSTMILLQPQKVSTNVVQSLVEVNIREWLNTIKQQVLSRTNLERIIEEHDLYNGTEYMDLLLEEKVELCRDLIKIDVVRQNAFSISFEGEDPKKTMEVTKTLAANFISENLTMREDRTLGTSQFITEELESVKMQLEETEKKLGEYQRKYMGALPENLNTNISMLGRFQTQLEQLNSNLQAAESRKLIIQQQISNAERMEEQMSGWDSASEVTDTGEPLQYSDGSAELISLREQLIRLKRRYTSNHPEVKRIEAMIAQIEAEEAESMDEDTEPESGSTEVETLSSFSSMSDLLRPQLEQIDTEIKNMREEIKKVRSQVELYHTRVEETPKRVQEMVALNRDYDNRNDLYNSLLNRKLEADISVNMEKKQKGEQFRVVDPAKIPLKPIRPNFKKIMVMAIGLGLGLGVGIIYILELMDTSYKTPDEAGTDLQVPVLASIPLLVTENELKSIKRREIFTGISVAMGFFMAACGIVIAAKGFDRTLEYVKGVFGG